MANREEQVILAQERRIQTTNAKLAKIRKDAKQQLREGEEVVAGIMTAGAAGYLEGKYPDKTQVVGVPITAVVGGALTLGSVLGYLPDEPIFTGVGLGALFAGAHGFGLKKGQASTT